MVTSFPSETAARPNPKPGWWWLAALGSFLVCSAITSVLAWALFIPDDVRPPFPTAELLNSQTLWDTRGLHTVRSYRVPKNADETLEWYFGEDMLAHYGYYPTLPFGYQFKTPYPDVWFPMWVLTRYSNVVFNTDLHNTATLVTVSTYYDLRWVEP